MTHQSVKAKWNIHVLHRFRPCRSLCERALAECGAVLRQYGRAWPVPWGCDQLPEAAAPAPGGGEGTAPGGGQGTAAAAQRCFDPYGRDPVPAPEGKIPLL